PPTHRHPPTLSPLSPYTTLFRSHALDLISNVNELRGMLHALGPRHLADVNQPFNPLLQLHERAVIRNADYASRNVRAYRIAVRRDRKSTRLNSSHEWISYAVFCL